MILGSSSFNRLILFIVYTLFAHSEISSITSMLSQAFNRTLGVHKVDPESMVLVTNVIVYPVGED